MTKNLKTFRESEDGAVSVDWVAMTAAIMFLAIAIAGIVKSSATTAGQQIGDNVAAMGTP